MNVIVKIYAGYIAAVFAVCSGCGGGEEVTRASLARAKALWAKAAVRDYDIEWSSMTSAASRYRAQVRDGRVRKVEMLRQDRYIEVHPGDPKYYGVDGLFLVVADDLAQLDQPAPFGMPKGTKVILRFQPDPELGYPKMYRRNVLGAQYGVAVDVLRFMRVSPEASASNKDTIGGG
ncbi:MAG: hypothetical protein KGM43_14625 [Planctomycetota bacterium]|nr:hypothetical protein [Planctomycetota bacterium]